MVPHEINDAAIDRFRFYAVQDALYLREFAHSLALCTVRAPEDRAGARPDEPRLLFEPAA